MHRHIARTLIGSVGVALLAGCSTMYYGTMEKLGYQKRDILVSRVKDARDTQQEAKTEIVSALQQFKSVVNVPGGSLEEKYAALDKELKRCESQANAVHKRVRAVEEVSEALFDEWQAELKQYSSDAMRQVSKDKLTATRLKYNDLIKAMKAAEAKLDPVLAPLRDQVLFLKHNLNAKAIAALGTELTTVQTHVDTLIKEMEASIAEADKFISAMAQQKDE
jgi:predicted  nucleic acid-binding Zn-ribbon protein